MKITSTLRAILCLMLILSICVTPVTADPNTDLSVENGCHSMDAKISILGSQQLITNVETAILYETQTQTLLYAWNPDLKMHPASLVKIMTALIAVEGGNLSDQVTVKADVINTVPVDAVSSELQPDEVLTLEDLLYCMMIDSANDAAAVIADYLSGSQDAFVVEMNRYAQELGCTSTQFKNVHGLHHQEQYTTARDMGKILAAALENEDFEKVFSTVNHTVAATNKSEERTMTTGNYLMSKPDGMEIYFDSRVTGGRTGVSEDGSRCLAACAESNGLQLISIVMGSKSVYKEDGYTVRSYGGFKETSSLFDFGFDGYMAAQVLYENQILTQRPVVDGSNDVVLGAKASAFTVLPEGVTTAELSFKYSDLNAQINAPVEQGEMLSHVQIWYGSICVGQADLFAMNSVKTVSADQRPMDTGDNSDYSSIILIAVLILIATAAIVLFVRYLVRGAQRAAAIKRSRRYRRNRRRSR